MLGNRTAVEVQCDDHVLEQAASTYVIFTVIVLSGAKDPSAEWREHARGTGVPLPDFHS